MIFVRFSLRIILYVQTPSRSWRVSGPMFFVLSPGKMFDAGLGTRVVVTDAQYFMSIVAGWDVGRKNPDIIEKNDSGPAIRNFCGEA